MLAWEAVRAEQEIGVLETHQARGHEESPEPEPGAEEDADRARAAAIGSALQVLRNRTVYLSQAEGLPFETYGSGLDRHSLCDERECAEQAIAAIEAALVAAERAVEAANRDLDRLERQRAVIHAGT
jgi:hypothetical protein